MLLCKFFRSCGECFSRIFELFCKLFSNLVMVGIIERYVIVVLFVGLNVFVNFLCFWCICGLVYLCVFVDVL